MVKTVEEIRELIDNDLDWMFKVGDVMTVDYEKNLKGEWDYILRIKFNPPTPMQLLKLEREMESFKKLMEEHGLYHSSTGSAKNG